MSKKKKKTSRVNLQKVSKAQQRNDFIKHLKSYCDSLTNSQVFSLIPQHEIETLYNQRCRAIRIIPAMHQKIPAKVIDEFKYFIATILKKNTIHIGIGSVAKIPFRDYFTYVMALTLFGERLKNDVFQGADKVKEALTPLVVLADSGFYEKAWQDYNQIINTSSILNSSITDGLNVGFYELKLSVGGDIGLFPFAEIHRMHPEKIQVSINGDKRPAYKLGWFLPYPAPYCQPATIKSEQLGLQPGFSLDVYVQAHALDRLIERMDGLVVGYLHYAIFDSFQNVKVCKNKKGDLLFEYHAFGIKTGYFKGDVIEGKLILRTFLFLTNNGTPEGERLHQNTGLMKEDKIYLTIDKCSTFVNSDIASNPRVKEIFIQAGCEDLFKLDKNIYLSHAGTKERTIADQIARYLKLGNTLTEITGNVDASE